MSFTVEELLLDHPRNPSAYTGLTSSTDKAWAREFHPITAATVRTQVDRSTDPPTVTAQFDDFFPPSDDDALRLREPAFPPTFRKWKLSYEEDIVNWFHTEISNIVLGGFARYPSVLQASHEKPLSAEPILETIDMAYSVNRAGRNTHIVIGEYKRNLINPVQWQGGRLKAAQLKLGQELRG